MEIKDLEKDAVVELEVHINKKTLNFNCQTVMIKDNFILVPKIVVNNQTVGFSDNCTVNLIYIREGKATIWENVIVKLVNYKGKIHHKIDVLGPGKPLNRRGAYRVYIGLNGELTTSGPTGPDSFMVTVKDISETGCAFISDRELDIGRHIRIRFRDNVSVELNGKIIRSEFKDNLNASLYACELVGRHPRLGSYLAKKQSEKLK